MPPSIDQVKKYKINVNSSNETISSTSTKKTTTSSPIPLQSSVPPIFPLPTSLPLNSTSSTSNSTLAPNLNKLGSTLDNKISLSINSSLNLKTNTPPATLPLPSNLPLLQNIQNMNNMPSLSQLLLSMNMNPLDMSSMLPFGALPSLNKQQNILPATTFANMQALMTAMNPAFAMANTFKNINNSTTPSKINTNLKKTTPIKPNLNNSPINNKSKVTSSGSKSPSSNSLSSEKKKIHIAQAASSSIISSSSQTPLKPLSPKNSTSTSLSGSAQTSNSTSSTTSSFTSFLNPKLPLTTPNLPLNPFFGANPLLFPALAQAASTNPLLFGSLAAGSNSANILNKLPSTKSQHPIIPTTSSGSSSSPNSTMNHPRPIAPQSKKQIHIAPAVNPINQRQSIFSSILASAASLQALQASVGVPIPHATSLSKTPTVQNTLNLNQFNTLLTTNKIAQSTTISSTSTSTSTSTPNATSSTVSSSLKQPSSILSTSISTATSTSSSKSSLFNKDKKVSNSYNLQPMNSTESINNAVNLPNIKATTTTTTSVSKNIISNTFLNNKPTITNNVKSNIIKNQTNDINNNEKSNKRSHSSELALALSKLEDALKKNMKSPTPTSTLSSNNRISNTINTAIKSNTTATTATTTSSTISTTSAASASTLSAFSALSSITMKTNINATNNYTTDASINAKTNTKIKINTEIIDATNPTTNITSNVAISNVKIPNVTLNTTMTNTTTATNKTDSLITNVKTNNKTKLQEISSVISNKNANSNITLNQSTYSLSHKDLKLKELSDTLTKELSKTLNNEKDNNIAKPKTNTFNQINVNNNLIGSKLNQNLVDSVKDYTGVEINSEIENNRELLSLDFDINETEGKTEIKNNIEVSDKMLEDAIGNALSNSLISDDHSTDVNDDQLLNLDLVPNVLNNNTSSISSTPITTPFITTNKLNASSLVSSIDPLSKIPLETTLETTFNSENTAFSVNDIQISKLKSEDKKEKEKVNKNEEGDKKLEIGVKRKLNELEEDKAKLTRTNSENQEISMDEVFDSKQFSSEEDFSLKSTEMSENDFPSPKKKKMMRWEKASFSPFQHNRRNRISKLKNAVRSMSTGSINTTLLAADPTIQNQFSLDTKSSIKSNNMEGFTNDYLNLNELNSMNGMNMNHRHNNK